MSGISERYDVLLFDLGGVVIELGGLPIWQQWTREADERAVWERWLRSPAVRRFESGRSGPREFAAEICAEFGLAVAPEDFLAHFTQWPKAPFPGVLELLEGLRSRFALGCLSNCNELHWPRFLGEMGLEGAFDHRLSSHQLGALKPDPEVFDRALALLRRPADRVLFLDDNLLNVEGARRAGLDAEVVRGPAGIRDALRSRGIEV